MDKEAFVEALNEDLELEYQSLVQYVQHIASVKGAEFMSVIDELTVHVRQELDHALALAIQVDFLGSLPSAKVPTIRAYDDPRAALEADLALEEDLLQRYRDRTEQANELGLPDVAEAIAPLMEQTQEHARDLRVALG